MYVIGRETFYNIPMSEFLSFQFQRATQNIFNINSRRNINVIALQKKRTCIRFDIKATDKKFRQKFNCVKSFQSWPKYTERYERYLSTEIKTGHFACACTHTRAYTRTHLDTVRFRSFRICPIEVFRYSTVQNNPIKSKSYGKEKKSLLALTQYANRLVINPAENLDSPTALIVKSNGRNERS